MTYTASTRRHAPRLGGPGQRGVQVLEAAAADAHRRLRGAKAPRLLGRRHGRPLRPPRGHARGRRGRRHRLAQHRAVVRGLQRARLDSRRSKHRADLHKNVAIWTYTQSYTEPHPVGGDGDLRLLGVRVEPAALRHRRHAPPLLRLLPQRRVPHGRHGGRELQGLQVLRTDPHGADVVEEPRLIPGLQLVTCLTPMPMFQDEIPCYASKIGVKGVLGARLHGCCHVSRTICFERSPAWPRSSMSVDQRFTVLLPKVIWQGRNHSN